MNGNTNSIRPNLDYGQAAHILGISEETLRHWVCRRKIEYLKVGKRVFFRPESLEKLFQESTVLQNAGIQK